MDSSRSNCVLRGNGYAFKEHRDDRYRPASPGRAALCRSSFPMPPGQVEDEPDDLPLAFVILLLTG